MENAKVILIGISGGIAVYKVAEVVSRLTQAGHDVHVAMTSAARRFVAPMTFASLSRRRVLTDIFPPDGIFDGEDLFPHLYPAARSDLFILAPATANCIARLAAGMADDIVTAAALALPPHAGRLVCPAMNSTMWAQPAVRRNLETLIRNGWSVEGPVSGSLACGTEGDGRLSDPGSIVTTAEALLARGADLGGRHILILSGPTREYLDPIRFLGNASSGRMGRALAEEAARRGAHVVFVTGPVDPACLPHSPAIRMIHVQSARDMLEAAVQNRTGADLEIFAAAVADFAPAQTSTEKQPKRTDSFALPLVPTPDIAAQLGQDRPADRLAIGFALESHPGTENATRKCADKRLHGIVLNRPESIGAESAGFCFLAADGSGPDEWGTISKTECARRILDWAAGKWAVRPGEDRP